MIHFNITYKNKQKPSCGCPLLSNEKPNSLLWFRGPAGLSGLSCHPPHPPISHLGLLVSLTSTRPFSALGTLGRGYLCLESPSPLAPPAACCLKEATSSERPSRLPHLEPHPRHAVQNTSHHQQFFYVFVYSSFSASTTGLINNHKPVAHLLCTRHSSNVVLRH